jgi:hypothetical protein
MFFHHIFHRSLIKSFGSSQIQLQPQIGILECCFWVFSKTAHLFLGVRTLFPLHQTFENLAHLLRTLLTSSASQLRSMYNILPPLGDRFFGYWIGLYLHKPQPLPFFHPSDTKTAPTPLVD